MKIKPGTQNKLKHYLIKILVGIVFSIAFSSCASVKSYEREYLNDEEMKLNARYCAKHEAYFQIIREGSSGADGGKTGGGCGCN